MSTRDIVVYLVLSAGLLAMPTGAFGLLDALGGNRRGSRRVTWLIATYAAGVLLCASALVLDRRWYLGAPLVLMLIPVETALRRHGVLRTPTAASEELDTTRH
ncbi:MAG: hypothetical protein J2P15_04465 [Micromonosporaceae bacterium]|nr:hypothetical protein [Micromonosporaceae bacterium]